MDPDPPLRLPIHMPSTVNDLTVADNGENSSSPSQNLSSFSMRWAKSYPTLVASSTIQYNCLRCKKGFNRKCDLKWAWSPLFRCRANQYIVAITRSTLVHTNVKTAIRRLPPERTGIVTATYGSMVGRWITFVLSSTVFPPQHYLLSVGWIAGERIWLKSTVWARKR